MTIDELRELILGPFAGNRIAALDCIDELRSKLEAAQARATEAQSKVDHALCLLVEGPDASPGQWRQPCERMAERTGYDSPPEAVEAAVRARAALSAQSAASDKRLVSWIHAKLESTERTKLQVWVRGGLAGELFVKHSDADAIILRLAGFETVLEDRR